METSAIEIFVSLTALVAAITSLTELFSRAWQDWKKKKLDGTAAYIASWGVGAVVCLIGSYFGLGMFASEPFISVAWWISGLVTSIVCTFVAQQIFDAEMGKKILEILLVRKKK